MKKSKEKSIIGLIIALVVILIGGLLFVGAASGWFDDPKITLDQEYYTDTPHFIDLDAAGYDDLIKAKKSFIILVDQNGCITAERVKQYTLDYMQKEGINIYKMMFEEVKKSSLHNYIKYYPSVVIIDKGKIQSYLKADSDEDADKYNDYTIFKTWLDFLLKKS